MFFLSMYANLLTNLLKSPEKVSVEYGAYVLRKTVKSCHGISIKNMESSTFSEVTVGYQCHHWPQHSQTDRHYGHFESPNLH